MRYIRAVILGLMVIALVIEPIPAYSEDTVEIVEKSLEKMKKVEAGELSLYFDPLTTEIVVEHKRFGYKWYSNPVHSGKRSTGKAADYVKSQVVINYLTDQGQVVPIDNYKFSIKTKQFTYKEIDKGFLVKYRIGDNSKNLDSFPQVMSGGRMRELILDRVDEKDIKYIKRLYRYEEDEDKYYARKNGKEQGTMSKIEIKKLNGIMYERAGYTEEDLRQDNLENGKEVTAARPYFEITLEYVLEEDGLRVRVLNDQTLWRDEYPIESINLLEYFGGTTLRDRGYMLVPDGSGAIIHLNNNKSSERAYSQKIYGDDRAQWEKKQDPITEKVSFPVFGTCTEEGGFLGIITSGAAVGTINADVSGRRDLYNRIYTNYTYKNVGTIDLMGKSSKQTVYIWSKQSYAKDIEVKYLFLDKKAATYSGMAKRYRAYLLEAGQLPKEEEKIDSMPFYLDLIGSYTKKSFFLGIPYTSVKSMTTFSQGSQILETLQEEGVDDIVTRYMGWFNKGIHHTIPKKVKVDSALGGKRKLQQFVEDWEKQGVAIYPDVAFQTVYQDTLGFSPRKDGARFLSGSIGKLYPYDTGNGYQSSKKEPYWLLAPNKLSTILSSFIGSYNKLKIDNLALRDIGSQLHTDFHNHKGLREQSRDYSREGIEKLSAGYSLLVDEPNDYAMAYTNHGVNVPLTSSRFNIVDEDVPFYQLVISGHMAYSAPSANHRMAMDATTYLMKCLETGSGIHYTWSYDHTSELKNTAYNMYNDIHYKQTLEEAVAMYKAYDSIMDTITDHQIVSHEILDNGLRRVTYGDGTEIILNYRYKTVSYEGESLKGKSYRVKSPRKEG